MTKRAVVAARVSSLDQVENTSLDAQIEKCRKYAELSDWEVVHEAIDPGVSGKESLLSRPAGREVLEMARRGEVDVIILSKLDRLARSVKGTLDDYDTLQGFGVELVFVEEKIDTTTPQGRLFRNMLASFAEFEREQIAERNLKGRVNSANRWKDPETGRVTRWVAGGHVPFGYAVADDKSIGIDPEDAEAVRLIFEMRAAGKSTTVIAKALNDRGFKPRKRGNGRKPFGDKLVADILTKPLYKGEGYEKVVDHTAENGVEVFDFPALVDAGLWAKAQTAYMGRKRKGRRPDRLYPLAERVTHAHGDGSTAGMFGTARRTGKGGKGEFRRWYRCNDSQASRGTGECDGLGDERGKKVTSVQADLAEAAVLWYILTQKPEDWEALLAEDEEAVESFDFSAVDARVETIEKKLVMLYEDRLEGDLSRDEWRSRKAPLEDERDRLVAERSAAVERGEGAELRGLTIEELLNGEILTEGDPTPEDAQVIPEEERLRLLGLCAATLGEPDRYGRTPALPDDALEVLQKLVDRMDVKVVVEENPDDWRRPRTTLRFEGTSVIRSAESGALASP